MSLSAVSILVVPVTVDSIPAVPTQAVLIQFERLQRLDSIPSLTFQLEALSPRFPTQDIEPCTCERKVGVAKPDMVQRPQKQALAHKVRVAKPYALKKPAKQTLCPGIALNAKKKHWEKHAGACNGHLCKMEDRRVKHIGGC